MFLFLAEQNQNKIRIRELQNEVAGMRQEVPKKLLELMVLDKRMLVETCVCMIILFHRVLKGYFINKGIIAAKYWSRRE